MRRVLALAAVLTCTLALPSVASALPAGSLDPTFGTNGFVRDDIFNDNEVAQVAVDSSGRTLVVGSFGACACSADVYVARYLPNGTRDPSFDGDGVRSLTSGATSSAAGIAIQSTGRILVGYSDSSTGDWVVRALSQNGANDGSFSTGGEARLTGVGFLGGMALDGDKILLAGDDGNDTVIDRLTAAGGNDSTFNTGGGPVTVDASGSAHADVASAVAAAPGGKIVTSGWAAIGGQNDLAVVRLKSDGSPDDSFDTDGIQTADFGDDVESAQSVAVMPDGRIVAAGDVLGAGPEIDAVVARFKDDGALDPSFSTDGKQTAGLIGRQTLINAVAVQPDGKPLVAGSESLFAPLDGAGVIYRFTTAGDPDTTFAPGGRKAIAAPGPTQFFEIEGLGLTPGLVTAVGEIGDFTASPPDDDTETALARVLTDADNCPGVDNPDQADQDGDGIGDACDDDIDGDGVSNAVEAAIGSNPRVLDSDGDGKSDSSDACPTLPGTLANGCPAPTVPSGGGGTQQPTVDKTPPKVTLSGIGTKFKRAAFLKNGITFNVAFDEPCTALVELIGTLTGGSHVAKVGDVVLAAKVLKLGSGQKITLKLSPRQKKLIGKAAKLTLRISAFDRTGNPKVVTRTIRVK